MSKRKRHAPVYEGEQSGTKRLPAPDEMKIGPTSSRGSFLQPEDPPGKQRIKHGVVVTDELELLSVRLGTSWKALARRLGFEEPEIVGFDHASVKHRDKAYQMLMSWKEREDSQATYLVLHDALSHKYIQLRELAERVCIDARPVLKIGPTSSRGSFLQPEDPPGVRKIKHGVVVDDELELLSSKLVANWRSLARRLQFHEAEIQTFDMENDKISEKVYMMLIKWKSREALDATYQVLHDALCHPSVNRRDLAYMFSTDASPSLSQIPGEIKAQGHRAVLAFQSALKSGKVKVYRGRIMFVGQDRAGKTSLKKSFLGLPFDPTQQSTDGIDVDSSKCEYEGDRMTNWKLTDEIFGISQHLDDIAKIAAKQIEDEETEAQPQAELLPDVSKETKHKENKVSDMEEETVRTKETGKNNDIPVLWFDPAAPPVEFSYLVQQCLKNVSPLTDANTKQNHITLDLWDFAGQDLYYASYPAFLSQRAVYMLVYNLSKGLNQTAQPCVRQGDQDIPLENPNQETNIENMLSWLTSICSLRTSKQDIDENIATKHLPPPVFIVGTHADTPYEDIKEMESQIRREITGMEISGHVIDYYAVDNTKGSSDERLVALKNHMIEVLNNEPYMGEEIPLRWLNFERVINALTEQNVRYLDVEQMRVIAGEKCFITDADEFDVMMNFYHDLGIIVKYQDTVILDAKWLVDLFRQLITIPVKSDAVINHWKDLEHTGILNTNLIDHIFKKFYLQGLAKMDILKLMEHFGLMAKISTSSTDEKYFVPAQVRTKDKSFPTEEPSNSDPCQLFMDFRPGFVPHGLFAQIEISSLRWVMKMNNRWEKSTLSSSYEQAKTERTSDFQLFLNKAYFTIRRDITHCLKLSCKKRFIKIVLLKRVTKAQQSPGDSSIEIATQVREFLENTLQKLSQNLPYLHGLQYKLCVPCPLSGSHVCKRHGQLCPRQDACLHLVEVHPYEKLFCELADRAVTVVGKEKWFSKTTKKLTGGNGKTTSVKNVLERRKIYEETVTVEGADWNLKLGAIHLTFHPYAVSEPTQIVVHEWKNSACLPPLLEHEAVVSNVIEISTINEKPLEFKGDVELFLSHSAPGLHGYELVIKRKNLYETKDDWMDVDDAEDLSSLQDADDLPSSMEMSKLLFPVARAHITECSTYAVVCRLRSSPRYEITSRGGCFNHPDYPGVTVTFPKKAVEPKTKLSLALKVQEVPAEEFEEQNVFPGPIIRVMCHDFVQFLKPVTIQLPVCLRNKQEGISYTTTYHAKVLYMETDGNHKEWVDMTDRLLSPPRCDGMYVRFQVKHFSGFGVVWCKETFHGFIRKLSNLFWYQPIRASFFAHYSPLDNTKGTVCLTTCSAAERPGIIQELINTKKGEIYSEITSRRYVIPEHDKAFVFVSGRIQPACMNDIKDFSLQFDRNGPYKDEIKVCLIEGEKGDAEVRFRSGPEDTPKTLLGRVTLKMSAAEARITELSHSLRPNTERSLPGSSDNIKVGQPTNDELELLSMELEEWKPLGRQLGFKGGDLTAVHKDNEEWSSKIFELLKEWKQWKGKGATYSVLYDALCYTTVRRTDLAQKFCCH